MAVFWRLHCKRSVEFLHIVHIVTVNGWVKRLPSQQLKVKVVAFSLLSWAAVIHAVNFYISCHYKQVIYQGFMLEDRLSTGIVDRQGIVADLTWIIQLAWWMAGHVGVTFLPVWAIVLQIVCLLELSLFTQNWCEFLICISWGLENWWKGIPVFTLNS